MSKRKYRLSWNRRAAKIARNELRILKSLSIGLDRFIELQRGSVIRLDTFHVVMAVQIMRNVLPNMIKEATKTLAKYNKRVK